MLQEHDYASIGEALSAVAAPVGPASAQGMLSGMRIIRQGLQPAPWMAWVLEGTEPRGEPAQRVLAALSRLFVETPDVAALDIERFRLLLPGDDQPLEQRCAALSEWCDGFLFGLGSQDAVPADLLRGEPAEALNALSAIAGLDPAGNGDATPDDEAQFVELVEFVRVAVLLLAASAPGALPSANAGGGSGADGGNHSRGVQHGS